MGPAAARPGSLILVRHAETEANATGVFHGRLDGPLTTRGLAQAARLAACLVSMNPRPAALYSSPVGRALATADRVAAALSLEVRINAKLRECDLGRWEGLPVQVLRDRHALWERARVDPDFAPHGGDSPRELGERAAEGLREVAARHARETVIVVSHGGALCAGLAVLLGTTPLLGEEYAMDNCAISVLSLGGRPSLIVRDERTHLGGVPPWR